MKEEQSRKTTPLDDPKLERLANLLGEFLAKAWLKRNATNVDRTINANKTQPVAKRMKRRIQ